MPDEMELWTTPVSLVNQLSNPDVRTRSLRSVIITVEDLEACEWDDGET